MTGIYVPLSKELLDRIGTSAKRQGRSVRKEIERALARAYEPKKDASDE